MGELAIVILNWNGHKDTIECIDSIRYNENRNYPIFVLDNGSKEESIKYIENWINESYNLSYEVISESVFLNKVQFNECSLYFIKGKNNLGFAKGNNLVWNKIKFFFNYILLLNNDTIIEKDSITKMLEYMNKNKNTGVVSCKINFYNNKDKLWNAGGYFTWYGDRRYYSQSVIDKFKQKSVKAISTPFVTGCVLMVRHSVSMRVGVFSEKFFFGEEDFNYCKRLQANNIKVESLLTSTIYHKVGSSIKKKQKKINSFVLHFSNRIINMKEFYKPVRWKVWVQFYLLLVFVKIWQISKRLSIAIKAIKYIKYYITNFDEITYQTFEEINTIS